MKYISVTEALSPFTDFSMVPPDRLAYAAQRGSRIHAACAAQAAGLWVVDLPQDHQGYFDSFKNWFDQYVKKVIWVEKELRSEKYFFKGHPDILAELISGETIVIDYKTPVTESPTWRAQLAAYAYLAKVEKAMALKLNPAGKAARAIVYTKQNMDFAAFLSALNAHRYFIK